MQPPLSPLAIFLINATCRPDTFAHARTLGAWCFSGRLDVGAWSFSRPVTP